MALFPEAIRTGSVSLLRYNFRSHEPVWEVTNSSFEIRICPSVSLVHFINDPRNHYIYMFLKIQKVKELKKKMMDN